MNSRLVEYRLNDHWTAVKSDLSNPKFIFFNIRRLWNKFIQETSEMLILLVVIFCFQGSQKILLQFTPDVYTNIPIMDYTCYFRKKLTL